MNRKQKAWFTFFCLLPFITAMTFRATDNYFFELEKKQLQKEKTNYFPKPLPQEENDLEHHDYACHITRQISDSLVNQVIEPLP